MSHVYRVAMTVRNVFDCADEVALAAALLHDTIEDTTTDFDDLARAFGEPVASIVAAVTKNMMLPEAQRETEYDARLSSADWRARLIKLADVYDNSCDSSLETPAKAAKLIDKCERAIALAKTDTGHPETQRGIAAVGSLLPRLRKAARRK